MGQMDAFSARSWAVCALAVFALSGYVTAHAQSCNLITRTVPGPGSRSEHRLVYDTARSALVSVGGYALTSQGDREVWELIDGRWVFGGAAEAGPTHAFAAVYDQARHETVVFGGYRNSGLVNETWVWDGRRWEQRPSGDITRRSGHAMAYDSRRGVVVLYGGASGVPETRSETWEWDGHVWTLRLANSPPGSREHHVMAYDSLRGVTVLYGGGSGVTWEWDGERWTRRSGSSPVWSFGRMAFDPVRGVTVYLLYRGTELETWEWDGTSWRQAPDAILPVRDIPGITYNPEVSAVIAFGDDSRQRNNGVIWAWDGDQWHVIDPGVPIGRAEAISYDRARQKTVLFKACPACPSSTGTWELDNENWSLVATTGPDSRGENSMVYDSARGVHVFFGGRSANGYLGDTWEWDGATWTQHNVPGPDPRSLYAMALDEARGVTVLFGGTNGNRFGDTWEWDGQQWTLRAVFGPSARERAAMVYDPNLGVTVLYSGNDGTYRRDTWEWDGERWTQRGNQGPGTRDNVLLYDPFREQVMLHAGSNGSLYERTQTGWALCTPTEAISDDPYGMAFDTLRRRYVTVLESQTRFIQHPAPCLADFDGNGTVNKPDLLAYVAAWTEGNPDADLLPDGRIDTRDLLFFLNRWAEGC